MYYAWYLFCVKMWTALFVLILDNMLLHKLEYCQQMSETASVTSIISSAQFNDLRKKLVKHTRVTLLSPCL
jgi:hypothetical protein